MPDNLRDRIAAVHQAHRWGLFRGDDGYARTCCRCQWRETAYGPTHAEHVADAVIEALGLKHYCRECGGWGPKALMHQENRTPNDLRTHIAKVLYWMYAEEIPLKTDNTGDNWDGEPESYRDTWRKDADAVIEALGLREENGWFGPTNIPKHRYVTDWEAHQ